MTPHDAYSIPIHLCIVTLVEISHKKMCGKNRVISIRPVWEPRVNIDIIQKK